MESRGGVRSSARLSGEAQAARSNGSGSSGNGRPAEVAAAAAAAAALRRARAAERAREVEDSPRVLRDKCRRLARALRNAKHLVVYTGAGISTAADIPDYRGPHGVWTRLQRGETVGRVEVSRALPTFTHMALTALWARGALKFVVSQNCDGLHLRAGLPRRSLAELHGDMFAELCASCKRVYLRAFDTTERTARHAHGTRRLCHACGVELRDSIVHFGERGRAAWPLNWAGALRHAARADVVLCLGSSLKVLRRYPRLWRMHAPARARPALYIVNLQWTPKDSVAALKINARCDAVMRQVARRLRLRVPRYRADADPLLAHAEPLLDAEAHTTRRPLLRVPVAAPPSAAASASASDLSSPSASDSDEELPLRRLAERLRAPADAEPPPPAQPPPAPPPQPPPPPPPPHPPEPRTQPPDLLRAFQVSMRSGQATILLRAQHAPAPGGSLRAFRMSRPPVGPRPPVVPRPPADGPGPRPARPALNGDAPDIKKEEYEVKKEECEVKRVECDVKREEGDMKREEFGVKREECEVQKEEEGREESSGSGSPSRELGLGSRLRRLLRPARPRDDRDDEDEAGALAAAIIARAVLVCRASLYPGLHTIIAPPAADCAWCLRRHASRRCLWYGPALCTAAEARAWRRVRARRVLCACCGDDARMGDRDPGGGGWYGKGYRKGRRRR